MFKILNGYENIDNFDFSIKEGRRIRGHEVTFAKRQCRLYILKKIYQRTVNEWNRLSADCVGTRSVNMFKNKPAN